jgi:hypothetical protein
MIEKPVYYVCSFGGCGSTMLTNYLSHFGKTKHIHSRNPPSHLTYVGEENTSNPVYREWFNDTQINENELYRYKVIYIYRNPLNAIYSRFVTQTKPNGKHLQNVQCDNCEIKLLDVINSKKDLYKIEEFFDNYTTIKERNYKIYCVNYDKFWDNIEEFNKEIGIPDVKTLYPKRKETIRFGNFNKELNEIYGPLIDKMNRKNFIEIV